jgi:hypothetical protein
MTEAEHDRKPRSIVRAAVFVGVACIVISGLAYAVTQMRNNAKLNLERQQAEWRQNLFDRVKQGNSSALVMDSKLLPMLANDADCRQIVTNLDFASTNIDPGDARFVAQLKNVTSITFYCTTGTKDLLSAAQQLPIDSLYFEMPDLPVEAYLMLKEFPQLKKVRFEHVMDDEWVERLESELPNAIVDAPYLKSK